MSPRSPKQAGASTRVTYACENDGVAQDPPIAGGLTNRRVYCVEAVPFSSPSRKIK